MSADVVKVRMLGPVTIAVQDKSIDDSRDRSRKVWLLLTYLLYNRKRPVPQEELIK